MTPHDEAVEAAARRQHGRDEFQWSRTPESLRAEWIRTERIGIEEYLRHMRAAGFVVTRVGAELEWSPPTSGDAPAMTMQQVDGWNACRRTTLANAVGVPE